MDINASVRCQGPRCQRCCPRCPVTVLSVRRQELLFDLEIATPDAAPENLMDCKFACHVTGIPRQEIHLFTILEVDKGTFLRISGCSTSCNLNFQQWSLRSTVFVIPLSSQVTKARYLGRTGSTENRFICFVISLHHLCVLQWITKNHYL